MINDADGLRRMEGYFVWNDEEWKTGGRNELGLDYKRLQYRLATVDGNQFTFDVRTGAIVAESRASHPDRLEGRRGWRTIGAWVAVAALAVVLLGWRRLRSFRVRHATQQRSG